MSTEVNVFIGNGTRSHRMNATGDKTLCGIDIFKAAKNLASDGDPGCNRCFSKLTRLAAR